VNKNIFVTNLSPDTTIQDLQQAFGQFGNVTNAKVVSNRQTGRSRGFGFVEMSNGADQAIEALRGADLRGQPMTVN
jgi:RNA recognition motif-containing protein